MTRKLLALLIIVSASLCTQAYRRFLPGKNTEGTIQFMAGDVTLNGKKAAPGDTVRFDDVVATGENSSCRIIIGGRNILALWPKTRLIYRVTTRGSNLELTSGGFGALLRNRDFTGDINLKTNTVTASIRGTIFCIAAESAEKTYACVCNGRVRLRPIIGAGIITRKDEEAMERLVSARHHAGHFYTREKGAVKIEKAGLLHHTDESVEKMAASIGEKIDWTKIE